MKLVDVQLIVKLRLALENDCDESVQDVVDGLEYDFDTTTHAANVTDQEIVDFSILTD